ncbi:hypothetical protein OY671_012704, partial [Metschnikowia pulcherrima]
AAPSLIDGARGERASVHGIAFLFAEEEPYSADLVAYWASPATVVEGDGQPAGISYWNPPDAPAAGIATVIPADRDPELQELRAAFRRLRGDEADDVASAAAERAALVAASKAINAGKAAWPASSGPAEDFVAWPADRVLGPDASESR